MALDPTIVWEVRSTATANNVNGGGFKPGSTGTDWSLFPGAQYNITTGTSAGAGAIILHASAAADMVGNVGHLISGTNATAGWYEILSVVAGVSITVDRNCTTGVGASIVFNIGGAISLGHSSDGTWAAVPVNGNTVWIKAGTYTIPTTNITFGNATATARRKILGYNASRGDVPTGTNRPIINMQAATFTGGAENIFENLIILGSDVQVVTSSARSRWKNIKLVNSSTTPAQAGMNLSAAGTTVINCEFISYRGNAVLCGGAATTWMYGCYIHDSNVGIANGCGSAGSAFIQCIVSGNVTTAIDCTGTANAQTLIEGCTIYGSENKLGVGISIGASALGYTIINNILYGLTTAIADANGVGASFGDFNAFNNNTANYSTFTAGANDVITAPSFTSIAQIKGTQATTAGGVLTDNAADFSNVVAGRDYIYLVSGTGVTAGVYGITTATLHSITPDIAPGNNVTADKIYQITTGRNFAIGTNYKALGFPGVFPLNTTTAYNDIGAVQRAEPGPSSGGGMIQTTIGRS